MLTLKINDKEVHAEPGATVLMAAREHGIEIPTLCHHEALADYGACRLCSVEVMDKRGQRRVVGSCLYPVAEGIQVFTDSERIRKGRKIIIELLLSRAPRVGILQELAREYEVGAPRFRADDKDCILCGMCVRVCTERLGIGAIGFEGRGTIRAVGIPFGEEYSDHCVACGACTYVCPTGAIQMEAKTLERFRLLEGDQRRCRYMMMGVAGFKLCSHNYDCWSCDVEQNLMTEFGCHPALATRRTAEDAPLQVEQFIQHPNLFYYRNHLWIKPMNGVARFGIDDFTARLLGRLDGVVLPERHDVQEGGVLCVFHFGNRVVALSSPIPGRIVDLNPEVLDYPELITLDPYGRGWLLTFEPEEKTTLPKNALFRFRAREWLKNDADKLRRTLQRTIGAVTFDRDTLASLIRDKMPDADWETLVTTFLMR